MLLSKGLARYSLLSAPGIYSNHNDGDGAAFLDFRPDHGLG